MLFNFAEIIAFVSKYFTLKMGDMIYTGTPAGVGPVQVGDSLSGYLNGRLNLRCKVC
jgi:2-keto-4-pentenoate hydratase/2-oxohepta-3-ene-1,7-dioic acid hydratase in catechol pathway